MAKFQNSLLSPIIGAKNDCFTTLKIPVQKNTKYSKIKSVLKMAKTGHEEDATALANVTFVQKLKIPKSWQKRFYDHIRVVLCKKPLYKTPNIQKIKAF